MTEAPCLCSLMFRTACKTSFDCSLTTDSKDLCNLHMEPFSISRHLAHMYDPSFLYQHIAFGLSRAIDCIDSLASYFGEVTSSFLTGSTPWRDHLDAEGLHPYAKGCFALLQAARAEGAAFGGVCSAIWRTPEGAA